MALYSVLRSEGKVEATELKWSGLKSTNLPPLFLKQELSVV